MVAISEGRQWPNLVKFGHFRSFRPPVGAPGRPQDSPTERCDAPGSSPLNEGGQLFGGDP